MSDQLRAAIRDGRIISQGRRQLKAAQRAGVIVCADRPLTAEEGATLKAWIADELAKEGA